MGYDNVFYFVFYLILLSTFISCNLIDSCDNLQLKMEDSSTLQECEAPGVSETLASFRKLYRPKGALARTLYDKIINDKNLDDYDRSKWYTCDEAVLSPAARDLFLPLSMDAATQEFLDQSCEKSDWVLTQMWHSMASAVLGWFMTRTSINGLLGRGSMFVLSGPQFRSLLPSCGGSLMDLGAGDGLITAAMAPFFERTFATEVSPTMRRQLASRGFTVLEVETWPREGPFDVVACLNVLDRCARPLSLLAQMREALTPGVGRALVALVLPFQPYVETGSTDHRQEEPLNITGEGFEEQVSSAMEMFMDAGFEVERWTRLPYLCEGDLGQAFYWLDDAVFVLKPLS